MRLFIGIPLSVTVVKELTRLTQRLRAPGEQVRWSDPATWHITLQFLGATGPEQYGCVVDGLRKIRHEAFEVQLEAPGFFERAGVFHAGVRLSSSLVKLQQAVTAATRPCGFVAEERPYHPHITLARSKGGGKALRDLKARLHGAEEFSSFTAGEFLIYESFLGPGGSRYEVRERFALGIG